MFYTQLYLQKNQKIPTIFVFIFVLIIFIFFIKLFNNSSIPSKASKAELKRIEITNLSPNQVTIFWQTDNKETGWLFYGKKGSQLNNLAYDDRDIATNKLAYIYHHVTIKNLLPKTIYQFKLVNDNKLVNNSSLFTFTTPPDFRMKTNMTPAYGKLVNKNNTALENAIVVLQTNNSFPLTSISKPTGEWLIPMFAIYQKDTLQQKQILNTEPVTLDVYDESGQTTHISGLINDISPITKTIIIGTNYSLNGELVLGTQSETIFDNTKDLEIIYPKQDSLIPGFVPIIKGRTKINNEILITVQGNNKTYATKTKPNSEGIWEVKINEKMLIGKYSMTAELKKQDGETVSDRRDFFIVANEGNDAKVLGVASSAPTITQPIATPTSIVIPTTVVSSESAQQNTPVSGFSQIVPIIGGTSLIILGLGILLAF